MKGSLSYNPKHIEFIMKDRETEEVTIHFISGTELPLGKMPEEDYTNLVNNLNLASQVYIMLNDSHVDRWAQRVIDKIPEKRKWWRKSKMKGMVLNVQAQ